MAPSGPAPMSAGPLSTVGMGNSVMAPAVVIRPILLPPNSANQTAPSGPAVIPEGKLVAVGIGSSVIARPPATLARLAPRRVSTVRSRGSLARADLRSELSGILSSRCCGVVELVQRPAVNRKVGGSIPPPTAILLDHLCDSIHAGIEGEVSQPPSVKAKSLG